MCMTLYFTRPSPKLMDTRQTSLETTCNLKTLESDTTMWKEKFEESNEVVIKMNTAKANSDEPSTTFLIIPCCITVPFLSKSSIPQTLSCLL